MTRNLTKATPVLIALFLISVFTACGEKAMNETSSEQAAENQEIAEEPAEPQLPSGWQPIAGIDGGHIYVLLESNGMLYGGTGDGVYQFDGTSWTALNDGIKGLEIWTLKELDGNLFVGSRSGVFKLNGSVWENVSDGLVVDESMYKIPIETFDSKLYAGTKQGVYVYDGASWTPSNAGVESSEISDIKVVGDAFYANATRDGLFKYEGGNWISVDTDGESQLAAIECYKGELYAAVVNGVMKYDGTAWQRLDITFEAGKEIMQGFAVIFWMREVGDDLFIYAMNNGVYKYNDTSFGRLTSAEVVSSDLMLRDAISYKDSTYLATANGLLLISPDGATATETNKGLSLVGIRNILEFEGEMYAAAGSSGVYKYDGEAWLPFNNGIESDVFKIVVYDNKLYASSNGLYVYDGDKWSPELNYEWDSYIWDFQVYNDCLYMASHEGIVVFDGLACSPFNDGLPEKFASNVIEAGGVLFARSQDKGISKLTDTTWTALEGQPQDDGFLSFASSMGKLYVAYDTQLMQYDGTSLTGVPLPKEDKMIGVATYLGDRLLVSTKNDTYTYDGESWSILNHQRIPAYIGSMVEREGKAYVNSGANVYENIVSNLTVEGDEGGKIVSGRNGKYASGEIITIMAEPASDHNFVGWESSVEGIIADTASQSTTFEMPTKDVVLKAKFE